MYRIAQLYEGVFFVQKYRCSNPEIGPRWENVVAHRSKEDALKSIEISKRADAFVPTFEYPDGEPENPKQPRKWIDFMPLPYSFKKRTSWVFHG